MYQKVTVQDEALNEERARPTEVVIGGSSPQDWQVAEWSACLSPTQQDDRPGFNSEWKQGKNGISRTEIGDRNEGNKNEASINSKIILAWNILALKLNDII